MKQIANKAVDLVIPENIQQVWIDPSNGLISDANCPGARQYPYIIGSEPVNSSSCVTEPSLDEQLPTLDGEPNPDETLPDNSAQQQPAQESTEQESPTTNNTKTWFNNFF
jgi:hypothetical protein